MFIHLYLKILHTIFQIIRQLDIYIYRYLDDHPYLHTVKQSPEHADV
jgi:uncharacterized integral membrane protein